MLYKIAHNTLVLGEQRLPFVRLVHDLPDEAHLKSDLVLEGYFNDIYKLFLRKLVDFEYASNSDKQKSETLQSLLNELLRIKEFLVNGRTIAHTHSQTASADAGFAMDAKEGAQDLSLPSASQMGNPFPPTQNDINDHI